MEALLKQLSTVSTLRTSLLNSTATASSAAAARHQIAPSLSANLAVPKSIRNKMLNYHNPDVDLLGLSNQDKSLGKLALKDEWVESWLKREDDFIKRGKTVRVGVLSGRFKPAENDKGGKKKKRK
ncbi:hypothetical protein HDU78_005694 [Chytriomyces hyalinus]|nr:hypothetical protein HDU78_005694 [Chytriomyces hyalinus]KAJ3266202.1 hypothetical protein HDU77_002333 [Chytriomyces hyalinus]